MFLFQSANQGTPAQTRDFIVNAVNSASRVSELVFDKKNSMIVIVAVTLVVAIEAVVAVGLVAVVLEVAIVVAVVALAEVVVDVVEVVKVATTTAYIGEMTI